MYIGGEIMVKNNFATLLKLKSIITLVMVFSLVIGWFNGKVTNEQFIPLVTMILTFYFAKKDERSNENQ